GIPRGGDEEEQVTFLCSEFLQICRFGVEELGNRPGESILCTADPGEAACAVKLGVFLKSGDVLSTEPSGLLCRDAQRFGHAAVTDRVGERSELTLPENFSKIGQFQRE